MKNKTPLCFPLSSLPRQFHVGCCRWSQGPGLGGPAFPTGSCKFLPFIPALCKA